MFYIGIDNGITGSVGIVNADGSIEHYFSVPTTKCLNYQKSKVSHISRINVRALKKAIHDVIGDSPAKVLLERPFVNPGIGTKKKDIKCECPECGEKFVKEKAIAEGFPLFFQASISAVRALEATLIVLESLNLGYDYVDSKIWQKHFFPKGKKGTELKKYSLELGSRKWPKFTEAIAKQKDADGLFIAEYCKVYHQEPNNEPKQDNLDIGDV